MSDYVTVADGEILLVVRTSDWRVVAKCGSQTFANQVVAGLSDSSPKSSSTPTRARKV